MGVLLGIVVIVALTVTMGATLFTNATTWKLVRDQRRRLHALPPEKRRRVVRQMVGVYAAVIVSVVVVLIAPWGAAHTITYLVIVPGLVVVVLIAPAATLAIGVRAPRHGRRDG